MGAPAPLLAGQTLPAETAQHFGTTLQPFIPDISTSGVAVNLGAGALQQGAWSQQGDWFQGNGYIRWGGAGLSVGTGTYFVKLPMNVLDPGVGSMICGSAYVTDSSTSDTRVGIVYWDSTFAVNYAHIVVEGAAGLTSTSPWTWATSDGIIYSFQLPGDF